MSGFACRSGQLRHPAEMQSYVSYAHFRRLKVRRGEEFVTPCMDDWKISREPMGAMYGDTQDVLREANKYGFEFKMEKGQFNQEFVTPCMDDLKISRELVRAMLRILRMCCARPTSNEFEFKMEKGQFNPGEDRILGLCA